MATPHACAALVDVFPDLLRARRSLVGTHSTPAVATLAVVVQHGPLRVSEVAEHLSLDLSTVSRQVGHLKQRGLLTSYPDPADGRSHRLSITPAGTQELRTARRAVVGRLVGHLDDWHDEEVGDLTRLLGRLVAAVEARPDPPPDADRQTARPTSRPTTHPTSHQKQLQGNA
ncbi:MarR family winged helix-turn-helix transcriptional regulator [Kineococcus sp. LSe6-4]|uniref:MarR family winged helix-turn-helix transcriptional regulator n=1 Tax=Kineococcus halophytocola TaxID=3234027 RepID=A0ABV4GZQ2_9ACTN